MPEDTNGGVSGDGGEGSVAGNGRLFESTSSDSLPLLLQSCLDMYCFKNNNNNDDNNDDDNNINESLTANNGDSSIDSSS